MGKILKYCGSCEEGFAERFAFCPDCGASLQAVQLNPVVDEVQAESAAPVFISEEPETITTQDVGYEADSPDLSEIIEDKTAAVTNLFTTPEMHADEPRKPDAAMITERADDDGYNVTVIPESNSKQRNRLLLGATGLVFVTVSVVTLVSLFSKELNVGSIDNPLFSAMLIDEIPMVIDEEETKKAEDDEEAGGGGGGGKNEKTPVSRGDLPDMTKNPSRPPDPNVPRYDSFELKTPPPQIQGPEKKFDKKYGQWGDTNGLDGPPSSGPGSGGGMGSGKGTGIGTGIGTGAGTGTGSGLGGGTGDDIGNGKGSGNAPPSITKAVTENYKILSKPRANYTDAGRTNSVQGTVRLKVTLLASGAVGSITPVTRLPHGMTEQAIAAARLLKFSPRKVNGVSQSVIVTLEYNFNLY